MNATPYTKSQLIPASHTLSNSQFVPHKSSLQRLGEWLIHLLVSDPTPSIQIKCDRNGKVIFKVFDPVTGLTTQLSSEEEVRVWLEGRYSHQPNNLPSDLVSYRMFQHF